MDRSSVSQFPSPGLPQPYQKGGEVSTYTAYPQIDPDDDSIDLREIWRILSKYRRTILLFAAIVIVTVAAATLMMRPVYQATAMLELTPQDRSVVRFQNVEEVSYDPRTFQRTQAEVIQSRAVAEAVIDRLDLAEHPTFTGELQQRDLLSGVRQLYGVLIQPLVANLRGLLSGNPELATPADESPVDAEDAARQRLIGRFRGSLSVVPVRDSNLFEVSFESLDPRLAAAAANSVTSEYIRLSGERRFESTAGAKVFLEREIAQVQARLETSEKELNDFARRNQVVDLEDRNNIISTRLTQLNADLSQTKSQRISAESLYQQARGADIDSLPTVLENELIATLKQNLSTLRSEYARLARTYKPRYPRMQQLQSQIDDVRQNLQQEVGNLIASLEVDYRQLANREQLLEQAVEQQKAQLLELQDRAVQYNILKRQWETNRELYSGLLERMKEVGVAAGMERDNASIIDRAMVPLAPFKPSLSRNVAIATILGLMGGIGLAFLLAFLDNTVRTPEEVERLVHLPSLGLVPKVDPKALPQGMSIDLLAHQQRDKDLSEAFRSVRTSLMFATPGGAPRVLMVTSASQGEGKSISAVNLGIVLAQTGVSVLLVDGDLRIPRLHKIFNVPRGPGLTEYLVQGELDEFYPTGIDNLSLLTAGTPPPNPAELLSSTATDRLLEELAGKFDYVIVDSAPVLGLADPVVLGTKVKGVLLVSAAGQVGKGALREAVKRLRAVNAPLVGSVLNLIEPNSSEYGYYNRYYYNYGASEERKRLRRQAA